MYNLNRAPLCPYIVTFIDKLVSLGSTETMNRVLENFMVVQEVRHNATKELLFCTVYAFEAAPHGRLPRHNVYKLVDGFDVSYDSFLCGLTVHRAACSAAAVSPSQLAVTAPLLTRHLCTPLRALFVASRTGPSQALHGMITLSQGVSAAAGLPAGCSTL